MSGIIKTARGYTNPVWVKCKKFARNFTPAAMAYIAGNIGLAWGAYELYKYTTSPPNVEYIKPETDLSSALNKGYGYFKSSFIERDGDSLFVTSSIKGNLVLVPPGIEVTANNTARGMWLALHHNDKETFDGILKGVAKLEGAGLPFSQSFLVNGHIISGPTERASDSKADQRIALALSQAYFMWGEKAYRDKSEEYMARIWSNSVLYHNFAVLKPSKDWGGETLSYVTVNPSSFSASTAQIFWVLDPSPYHNWLKLSEDITALIKTIMEATSFENPDGTMHRKTPFTWAPNRAIVSWTHRGINLFFDTDPARGSVMGKDGVETFLQIGYDALWLKDFAPKQRDETIKLARKIVGAFEAGKIRIPEDVTLMDEKGNAQKGSLAAYPPILSTYYAASLETSRGSGYREAYQKLRNRFLSFQKEDGAFGNPQDSNYAYSQGMFLMAGNLIGGNAQTFIVPRFSDALNKPGKEARLLLESHWAGSLGQYGGHAEYIPIVGGHGIYVAPDVRPYMDLQELYARKYGLETQLFNFVGLRNPSDISTHEFNLEIALQARALRKFMESTKDLQSILAYCKLPEGESMCSRALREIYVGIEEAELPPYVVVNIFEKIHDSGVYNPYAELGLAIALFKTYEPQNFERGLKILNPLKSYKNHYVLARVYETEALILGRQEGLIHEAINSMGMAEKYASYRDVPIETKALIKIEQGQLYKSLYALNPIHSKEYRERAQKAFEAAQTMTKGGKNLLALHVKASLELSFLLRESLALDPLLDRTGTLGLAEQAIRSSIKKLEAQFYERLTPIDKYTHSGYVELLIEEVRISQARVSAEKDVRLQELLKVKLARKARSLSQNLTSSRLRTSFERVIFFLDNGIYAKAYDEAKSLKEISDSLETAKGDKVKIYLKIQSLLWKEEDLGKLRDIGNYVSNYILPQLWLAEDVGVLNDLTRMINGLSDKKFKERLFSLLKSEEFDLMAAVIETKIRQNNILSAFKHLMQQEIPIDHALEGLTFAKNVVLSLTPSKSGVLDKNGNATTLYPMDLKEREKAYDTAQKAATRCCDKFPENQSLEAAELLSFYKTIIWAIRDIEGNEAALAFVEELLNIRFVVIKEGDFPVLEAALVSLRTPQNRSSFNLTDTNSFYDILGNLYMANNNRAEAIRAWRQFLGLSPLSRGKETDIIEFGRSFSVTPQSLNTIIKIIKTQYPSIEEGSEVLKKIMEFEKKSSSNYR